MARWAIRSKTEQQGESAFDLGRGFAGAKLAHRHKNGP
ncbi:hypothetical protein B4113_2143 [Geobacillus sp. B4113_201601]|nr:hypothetical protein B4113_2143 [Geobacillus sp. B4113_201601]